MIKRKDWRIGLMPAMVGALAMVAQVAYLRLTAQSFYGNELTMCIALGHWLVWTGIGSLIGTRIARSNPFDKWLSAVAFLYCLILIAFAGLLYMNRRIAGIPTSAVVGLGTIFAWTFIFFSLPALLNGLFFPLIIHWVKARTNLSPVHLVYAAEVIGSAVGSLAFAGLIILGVNTFNCLLIFVWLMAVLAIRLFTQSGKLRFGLTCGTFVVIILALSSFQGYLTQWKWYPFQVVAYHESPHSALTTVRYREALSIYSDSQPLWTFNEPEQAEELTHFAMLNHPNPVNVLVVGIGNVEICREIRRHPSVRQITILQPDRILQQTLNQIAPLVTSDSTIRIVIGDPALFLRQTDERFDVVLMNIPLPVNAQWNRFYTVEFLKSVARRTGGNGVVMLNFPGDEEFLTTVDAEFLKTMQNTVRRAFKYTTWIPGQTIHLLTADFPLINDLQSITHVLKTRHIKPVYINEYFLTDRLSPLKIEFLTKRIAETDIQAINSIARPVGYYYDTMLWGQRTGGVIKKVYPFLREANPVLFLIGFAGVLIVIGLITRRKPSKRIEGKMAARQAVGIGFWVMGLESVAIILFQSLVGSVYLWIVFLTFTYMLGSGIGAIAELQSKRADTGIPRFAQILMVLAPGGLVLPLLWNWPGWVITILIGLILLAGGFIAGFMFPVLVRNFAEQSGRGEGAGRIYAADIIGSALGVYLISGIVVPVWGIIPAVGVVILTIVVTGYELRVTGCELLSGLTFLLVTSHLLPVNRHLS